MKLNNPATLLLGAAVLGVGVMALAGRRAAPSFPGLARAENGCSRIVIRDRGAVNEVLAHETVMERIRGWISSEESLEEAARKATDYVVSLLVPDCPSPLPGETIFVYENEDTEPMTLEEIRDQMWQRVQDVAAGLQDSFTIPAAAGAFTRNIR